MIPHVVAGSRRRPRKRPKLPAPSIPLPCVPEVVRTTAEHDKHPPPLVICDRMRKSGSWILGPPNTPRSVAPLRQIRPAVSPPKLLPSEDKKFTLRVDARAVFTSVDPADGLLRMPRAGMPSPDIVEAGVEIWSAPHEVQRAIGGIACQRMRIPSGGPGTGEQRPPRSSEFPCLTTRNFGGLPSKEDDRSTLRIEGHGRVLSRGWTGLRDQRPCDTIPRPCVVKLGSSDVGSTKEHDARVDLVVGHRRGSSWRWPDNRRPRPRGTTPFPRFTRQDDVAIHAPTEQDRHASPGIERHRTAPPRRRPSRRREDPSAAIPLQGIATRGQTGSCRTGPFTSKNDHAITIRVVGEPEIRPRLRPRHLRRHIHPLQATLPHGRDCEQRHHHHQCEA